LLDPQKLKKSHQFELPDEITSRVKRPHGNSPYSM
jgi:hypothetical protein